MTAGRGSYAKKVAINFGDGGVGDLLRRQNSSSMPAYTRAVKGGAIGCLGGQALPDKGNALFFTGVPIRGPNANDIKNADDAQRLLPHYDGAFAGFFWDDDRKVLVIVTDCLGMQPLYIQQSPDQFKVVSETKAIHGEPDLAAWGAFISIGHPIGDRSLVKDLKRVPPATILMYDCVTQSTTTRRYWDWPEPPVAWQRYDFIEALEADVQAYARLGLSSTTLLSGGFDSRLLLFLLLRAGLPPDSLGVDHHQHQNADGRFAERIAQKTGAPYEKAHPPTDFFSSKDYVDYLAASDVGFPSLGLFIAKVAPHIRSEAIWDGLAPGFIFMPLHQLKGGFKAYLKQEVRGHDSTIWRAARSIFRPDVAEEMKQDFADDLQATIDALPPNAGGLARFVIENRSRNRAGMNPLKVYANRTVPFTPGLSKELLSYAAHIPFDAKQNGQLYLKLFAKLDRRALEVPFSSGGELIAPKKLNLDYYQERIRSELNRQRARHPQLFSRIGWSSDRKHVRQSKFLDARLLKEADEQLAPDLRQDLSAATSANYEAWKLLFHWRAWQWLHEGRLEQMLEPEAPAANPE